jgi:hypothetical protein
MHAATKALEVVEVQRRCIYDKKNDCRIFLCNLTVSFEEESYYDRFGLPQICSSVVVKLVANGGRFQRTKATKIQLHFIF